MRYQDKFHWFNVQTNAFTAKDTTGALNRQTGWSNLKVNVRGHIQQVNRGDALEKYDIKVAELLYVIFFDDSTFIPDASTRFIINKTPKYKVPLNPQPEEIKILEFIAFNEGYIGNFVKSTVNTLEIYAQHNKRWTL